VRPGSRYFKAWCTANQDRLPSRNAKMHLGRITKRIRTGAVVVQHVAV
jgi:hypothetical protein